MSSIPLYINLPIAPSLSKALTALERDGYYSIHLVKFDVDILKLMIATRPCASVFSITDEASYSSTFEMLENLKKLHSANGEFARQPALRMILVAEHWGVTLERWMEVGIHEFIPAPITKKALTFKLNRHYVKAVSSAAANEGQAPVDPFSSSDEEILVKQSEADSPPDRQTFYIPGGGGDLAGRHERIVIIAQIPLIGTGLEVWKPVADSIGFEETWVAVIPGKIAGSDTGSQALFFTGDKPVYDKKAGHWIFQGEAPKLVHRNSDSSVIDPNLFVCSTDRTKVFVKDSAGFSKFEIKHQSTEKPANPPTQPYFISGAEPALPAYNEASPVKDIADFLDQWKPKERAQETTEPKPARIHGSGGLNKNSEGNAPDPRKSSPEAPLPGHYSGPGMRSLESDFNTKLKPGDAKPAAFGSKKDTTRLHGAESLTDLPPEPEPEWPSESEPDSSVEIAADNPAEESEAPANRAGDTSAENSSSEPDGKNKYRAKAGALDPKKDGLSFPADNASKTKEYSAHSSAKKKSKARMSFPIFSQAENPKELRSKAAEPGDADAPKANLKKISMETTNSAADYVSNDESRSGFQNLSSEAHKTKELEVAIHGQKQEPEKEVQIKNEAPEGSLTWSMQSEENSGPQKQKKRSLAPTDDGGRVLPAAEIPLSADALSANLSGKLKPITANTPDANTAGPHPAGQDEALPEANKNETWLDTVRRVLARIFS